MKALRKFTQGGRPVFRIAETPEPQIRESIDVKIKVKAIGVCTSDIHALHGAMTIPDGNIVGHEFSGVVVAKGDAVSEYAIGDRVVSELAIGKCGTCKMCKAGKYEFCIHKRPQGWASPGVYAEYTVSRADLLHRIPEEVGFQEAALTEPIAICVYGCLERARIRPTDSVVVYGMGSIGLLSLIVLLDAGVGNIICVTPTRHGTRRFDVAGEIGAPRVMRPEEEIGPALEALTGSSKADVVVDCSGVPSAVNAGMELLRKDGTFVALGIAAEQEIPFRYNTGVLSAVNMVFSCTSSHSSWVRSLEILKRRQKDVRLIIDLTAKLDDWETAYQKLENREAIKAVLLP